MIGQKIKIINSIDSYLDGQLPYDMIGKEFSVTKVDENGIWVFYEGYDTLVLDGEYEVVNE